MIFKCKLLIPAYHNVEHIISIIITIISVILFGILYLLFTIKNRIIELKIIIVLYLIFFKF